MTFLKPQHLFEVYIYESTKKNAFSIMNSEPTSSIRRKIYADRYEISGGGLTFYQTMKNAADELEQVPVISFPQGKWESVSMIKNRMIIAENKTGASTGASHISIQSEIKKPKNVSSNSFKIIQMPPSGNQEENKDLIEVNKIMEQVNKLLDSQKDIIKNQNNLLNSQKTLVDSQKIFADKISQIPTGSVSKMFIEEEKVERTQPIQKTKTSLIKEEVNVPVISEPIIETSTVEENTPDISETFDVLEETSSIFPDAPADNNNSNQKYSKEEIDSSENWDDLALSSDDFTDINDTPSIPTEEINSFDVISQEIDDFDLSVDIDAIAASLNNDTSFIGEEVKTEPEETIKIQKPVATKPKEAITPAPEPLNLDNNDDILGMLESLDEICNDTPQMSAKEKSEKAKEFIKSNLVTYLKMAEIFRFDHFHAVLKNEDEYTNFDVNESVIYWEVSQQLLEQKVSPKKFIKEKLQKHIALILPGIMKKNWDGSIINILDIAKEQNEIKDITLIDLAVWMAQNGFK